MINKYTNKQGGLLAVIMAMVMVFAGAAFVAAEVDAADTAITASGSGVTIDGTTITLNNYDGPGYFEGNYTSIVLIGENKITTDAEHAIKSTSTSGMTITNNGSPASLEIVLTNDRAHGIKNLSGSITIYGVDITVNGGNRAIYTDSGEIVLGDGTNDTAVTVSSSEYGIRNNGTLTVNAKTTVSASITTGIGNGEGTGDLIDSCAGIKVKNVTIAAGATVTTESMFLVGTGSNTINGELNIEYDENAGNDNYGPELYINDGATLTVGASAEINVAEGNEIYNIGNIGGGGSLVNGGSDSGYSLSNGILTLNNYTGSQTFSGINGVVIIGDNTITVQDDAVTSVLSGNIVDIKTVQGIGSLTIILEGKVAGAAIDSNTLMTINGVTIDIKVSNTWEIGDDEGDNPIDDPEKVVGISSTNLTTMYSTITVDVDDTQGVSMGIDAGSALIMTKSALDVVANKNAIRASQMTIAGSSVQTTAEEVAIVGGLTITNESTVVAEAPVYGIKGSVSAAQDSTVTTSGMCITGTDSINNAIITNNGDMVIASGATFTNKATFTNDGIIGMYGNYVNASGETINNGAINTYGYDVKATTETELTFRGTNSATATLTLGVPVALADGTYSIPVIVENGTEDYNLEGTMTYSSSKVSIKAVGEGCSVSISATYKTGSYDKFTVVVTSAGLNVNEKYLESSAVPDENKNSINGLLNLVQKVEKQDVSVVGGKLTNNGTMSIATAQTVTPGTDEVAFMSAGEIVNAGEMKFSKDITIIGGKISGNDITVGKDVVLRITGEADIGLLYAGDYKVPDEEDPDKEVTVSFDNAISVAGKFNDLTLTAIGTTALVPAVFQIGTMGIATDSDGNTIASNITLSKGTMYGDGLVLADGVTLEILAGATLQAGSGKIQAKAGVIASQDGAILNVKGDAIESYSFGELVYSISFAKDGYTYYGSLTYALANASEGMTLVLNNTETIEEDLVVGKGITLQFAKNATLSVGSGDEDIEISMLDGAKFEFTDDSNEIVANGNVKLSGTFVYDGNELILDGIKFVNGNEINCTEASKNDASNIALVISEVKEGTVKAQAGIVKVSATFSQDTTNKTASALVIAEGATAIETEVTMNAGASVTIDGTYKPANDIEVITSTINGTGAIVLGDNKAVKFDNKAVQNVTISNGTDKVVLAAFAANAKVNGTETNDGEVTITSVAKSGSKAAHLSISGKYYAGTIQVIGNAGMNALTVESDAALDVPAGSVITLVGSTTSTATGLVKVAGTINMKVEGDSTTNVYGVLDYDITYTDGDYTVYTVVLTAIENAESGDVFELTEDLEVTDKLEIPAGVTIVVPEDYVISLGANAYLIIGDAPETLGATGGIQGTVEIANATAYVIAFVGVDMSQTKIIGVNEKTDDIINSQISANNQLLATIYVDKTSNISFVSGTNDVASKVQPNLEGYRFVKWLDATGKDVENTNSNNIVGKFDFVADLKADMVQITFTAVEGLTYYVNNLAQNTVGAPVYVEYGSTITAAPVVGYTGTALVNGQSYIVVDSETSVITGSGVTEKVTEIVTEDEGMELTDILLIVLVVLIVIMAIIVALRMMRS